ncbi:MAG: hypothetical protein ACYDCH_05610 [Gaiellaceae bacterium]
MTGNVARRTLPVTSPGAQLDAGQLAGVQILLGDVPREGPLPARLRQRLGELAPALGPKDPAYLAAAKTFPAGAVALAYASPQQAHLFLGSLPGQTLLVTGVPERHFGRPSNGGKAIVATDTLRWATAAVVVSGGEARIAAHANVGPPPESELETASLSRIPTAPYEPRLLDEISARMRAGRFPCSSGEPVG